MRVLLAFLLAAACASAAAYPDKPVQYLIPFGGDLQASVAGGHVSGAMSYLPFAIHALNQDPAMRKTLSDTGYDVIDFTLEKMPAFLAEKAKAHIEDARAAGLLK